VEAVKTQNKKRKNPLHSVDTHEFTSSHFDNSVICGSPARGIDQMVVETLKPEPNTIDRT
jgi:hypothetical protein